MDTPIIGQLTNCDRLYCAKIAEDSVSAYTAAVPEYLAPVAEVKEDPKVTVDTQPFDGIPMFHYASEGESENALTISGLTEKKVAELTGKPYDSAKGVVFDNGSLAHMSTYALAYRLECKDRNNNTYYKYRWFLKGIFVFSASTAKTAGTKVDAQSQEVTFYPQKTIHQWSIPDPKNAGQTISDGLKIVKTDTTDPAFTTESSWFSQVQTPDTIGAPTALALSSIVPAAAATGVLATANVVLTFSNVIASHSIKLVDDVTDAIVPAAYSFDSTGKILTINPAGSMTAGDKHAVAIFGVKDIYGQSLADSLSYFTVAS